MTRTRWAWLALATMGCGGAQPAQPTTGSAEEHAIEEPPEVVEPSDVPAPLGGFAASEGAVWVEQPRFEGSQIVFPEEIAPFDEALERALVRAGYVVVPTQERRVTIARMTSGYVPERRGACQPLPAPARYLGDRYGDLRRVTSTFTCRATAPSGPPEGPGTGCVLRVEVRQGTADPLAAAELTLPIDTSMEQLVAELDRAALAFGPAAPNPLRGALMGPAPGGFGRGLRSPVEPEGLETAGGWSRAQQATLAADLRRALVPQRALLSSCGRDEPRLDAHANSALIIEVGLDGRTGRCEAALADHLPSPGVACECDVLRRALDLGPATAPRRMRLELDVEESFTGSGSQDDVVVSELHLRQASDASVLLGRIETDPFERCVRVPSAPFAETRIIATVDVGAEGRVTDASLVPLRGDTVTPELVQCVTDAMRATRFTCPFSGRSRIRADLVFSRTRRADERPLEALMRRAAEVTITIPSTRWHTDAPAARITTALVARDGQVSDGSADSLRQARAAGQPLGLVVDRDLPAAALATLLVGVGTPTSQRVYVLTTVYGGPTWRALFLAPDALPEGADVVEVDGGAITRGQAQRIESSDPETLARLIDGELSTPVHLAAREGTTVGQLLVAIDAADVRNRRAVWMLGAPRRSTP